MAFEAEAAFSCDPRNVALARAFVESAVRGWGFAGDSAPLVLLVSELVTNSVIHGETDIRLHVHADGGVVTVEVADDSARLPRLAEAGSDDATSGRGLMLVDQLAQDWGVRSTPDDGKVVWCRVAMGPSGITGA